MLFRLQRNCRLLGMSGFAVPETDDDDPNTKNAELSYAAARFLLLSCGS